LVESQVSLSELHPLAGIARTASQSARRNGRANRSRRARRKVRWSASVMGFVDIRFRP